MPQLNGTSILIKVHRHDDGEDLLLKEKPKFIDEHGRRIALTPAQSIVYYFSDRCTIETDNNNDDVIHVTILVVKKLE